MASGPGVNHGKTAFVQEYLDAHKDANHEAVNEAWVADGHEGTVSDSLVNKVRQKLGLTGRRRGRTASKTNDGSGRSKTSTRSQAEPSSKTPRQSTERKTSKAGLNATHHTDEDEILDELEEGIDELVDKVKAVGGRPDVVKALRRARRLLVQGHEGQG